MAEWSERAVRIAANTMVAITLGFSASALAAAPDGFRPLAPGTLIVIPPDTSADDTMQRGDILEITRGRTDRKWTPKRDSAVATLIEQAKNRTYPRDVWCLEFAYKPPRLIDVDVPGPELKMRRKRLWWKACRCSGPAICGTPLPCCRIPVPPGGPGPAPARLRWALPQTWPISMGPAMAAGPWRSLRQGGTTCFWWVPQEAAKPCWPAGWRGCCLP